MSDDSENRMPKLVAAMHAYFESLTNQRLTLSYQRTQAWYELIQRGYVAADLALVVRWIKSQMGKPGTGFSAQSLQFSRLIQDPDLFEDRLNMARQAFERRPTPPARQLAEQHLPDGTRRQVEVSAAKDPELLTPDAALEYLRQGIAKMKTE